MASSDDPLPDTDVYDLTPQTPKLPRRAKPAPTAALGYRAPRDDIADSETETLKNLKAPLWLLAAGVLIKVLAAFFIDRGAPFKSQHDVPFEIAGVGIELVIGTTITLIAILIAARLREIHLGPFRLTVLKLAAVSIFPSALLTLVSPILEFNLIFALVGLVGEFVLYFALLGVFFDLDESDTWYCVAIIFLVNLAVYFLLSWMLGAWG